MGRLGGYENESHQAVLSTVGNPMILARGRQHDLSRPQFLLLFSHFEHAPALDHIVNLVLTSMRVRLLLLPGLKTVKIAEEPIGFEDPILLHLLFREMNGVGQRFEMAHSSSFRYSGYYHS